MSYVVESTIGSAAQAATSRRPVPERWGPIRALATWLGFTAKGTARASASADLWDEQKEWVKARAAMVAVGDGMLTRSRRDHQPLTMVVLDVNDLPQLTRVLGTDIAAQFVSQALGKLNGIATSTGFAARTAATVFTVLLPGFTHERAVAALHEALGSPCRIEYHAGEHDAVLAPEFTVQTIGGDALSVGEVYQTLRRSISQSRSGDQRRESPVRREREPLTPPAQSRPTSGSGLDPAIGQSVVDPLAATIPVPLGLLQRERQSSQAAYCPTAATIPMPMGPR
jgi:GGDEF domain-containing protein